MTQPPLPGQTSSHDHLAHAAAQARRALDRRLDHTSTAITTAWDHTARILADHLADLAQDAAAGDWQAAHAAAHLTQALAAARPQLTAAHTAAVRAALADLDPIIRLADHTQHQMIQAQAGGRPLADLGITLQHADPAQITAITRRCTRHITARAARLPPQAETAIRAHLQAALAAGWHPDTTADRTAAACHDACHTWASRYQTIARTEQLDAHRAAAYATQQANRDILAGWEWVADLDQKTCRACIAMHGTRHPVDEPGPDDHPNGRCARVPITKPWSDLGIDLPDTPSPWQPGDGPAWLETQSPDVQRHILGDRGRDAWKNGDWPPDQWARQNPATTDWRRSYTAAPQPRIV